MVGTFVDICYIGLCSISSIHSTSVFSFILFSSVVLSSTLLWTVWGAFWRSIYPYISVWEAIFLFQRLYKKCTQLSFAFQIFQVNGIQVSKQLNFSWQYLAITLHQSQSIRPLFLGNKGTGQYVYMYRNICDIFVCLLGLFQLLQSSISTCQKCPFASY